jgi:hypothetical protein
VARVEFGGGVTSIKGKIGGSVFQSVNGQSVIRSKGNPKKSITSGQSSAHGILQGYLYQWSLLSLLDKIAWNDYSKLYDKIDVFGNVRKLTGFNFFMSVNSNLVGLGGSIITTPPSYVASPAMESYIVSLNSTTIRLTFSGSIDFDDYGFAIYAGNASYKSSNLNFSGMRLMKYIVPGTYSYIDITSEWSAKWSLVYADIAAQGNFNIQVCAIPIHYTSGAAGAGLFNIGNYTA